MKTFDLTPDPKILIALTHTPMLPLDALCELIDNAIDSFNLAKLMGIALKNPLISIELPRPADLNRNSGLIRVQDNGPGLTADMAEKAIRAGFSSNNPFDSLGLFGMGFNISSGKLGRVTRMFSARSEDNKAIEVTIDLDKITQSRNYLVPFNQVDKPVEFLHGTVIEIDKWWPDGNPNSGFIKKLIQYGLPTVRSELGRRYATILREKKIRILINGELCETFEHCIWDDARFVERRGHGKIPAIFRFDESIHLQKRCVACNALIPHGQSQCASCDSLNVRTIEERVRGWVGIQRFDSDTNYGIDLIRNGRAIRIAEKNAFFEFVDEFKKMIKDYPIDGTYGRIVGEVHLNHVPVDFLKQDYQRSSPEWQRAMTYLRGDSSLQPSKPGADLNTSPLFKLYQGYRKVRTYGTADMYMGYWDEESKGPKRITRDIETEYYEKFRKKLPGYYDDSEWWKLVEQADKKPLEDLIECPSCGSQNLKDHDMCNVCGEVLIPKTCINPDCSRPIAQSAQSCSYCGTSQIPLVEEPWGCLVCGTRNTANHSSCTQCGNLRGTENTLALDYLLKHSNRSDELSIPGCSIILADESYSFPIDVYVYVTSYPITANNKKTALPLITFKGEKIEIFIDKTHKLFKTFKIRPEQMIASEVALFIYDVNKRLSGKQYYGVHTLSNLEWTILNSKWADTLEDSPEKVREDIYTFFDSLKEKMPALLDDKASDCFDELIEEQKKKLVENLLSKGEDISRLGEMKKTGEYFLYLEEEAVVDIFHKFPGSFLDGNYFSTSYSKIFNLSESILNQAQDVIKNTFTNCLEDITSFLKYRTPESSIAQRARLSLDYLQQKVIR